MAIEIGRNTFEGARAIEHGRAEPEPMGAWPHDRHIALVPLPWKNVHVREWLTDLLMASMTPLHVGD